MPALLASFSLYGCILECRPPCYSEGPWFEFTFWGPPEYERTLTADHPIFEEFLYRHGLTPISEESEGNMWVTSLSGGPNAEIQIFNLSGRECTFASSRLSLLMASMAVSEASFLPAFARGEIGHVVSGGFE